MEGEFEHAVTSGQMMNGMLATYESTLLESYGGNRRTQQKTKNMPDKDGYMIFDSV